ncbi:transformer-2 protein [Enteropsectra breve]|nr:transformer-2 protein [Enteropsectra breve]
MSAQKEEDAWSAEEEKQPVEKTETKAEGAFVSKTDAKDTGSRPSGDDRDNGSRYERNDRPPRFDRNDRPPRFDRNDRPPRYDRDERPSRFSRDERPSDRDSYRDDRSRYDRSGRDERPRYERSGRDERDSYRRDDRDYGRDRDSYRRDDRDYERPRYERSGRDRDDYGRDRDSDRGYKRSYDDDYAPKRRRDEGSFGDRAPAEPNETLGLFNLPYECVQRDLDDYLEKPLEKFRKEYQARLILDRMTGRAKGFGFITFKSVDDAIEAKNILSNGEEFNGKVLRVDFAKSAARNTPYGSRDQDGPRND